MASPSFEEVDNRWYVRKTNGIVIGPVSLKTCHEWAARNTITPDCRISADRIIWQPAPENPELKMEWVDESAIGKDPYGPFNLRALPILVNAGLIAAAAQIVNRNTGNRLDVSSIVKTDTKNDASPGAPKDNSQSSMTVIRNTPVPGNASQPSGPAKSANKPSSLSRIVPVQGVENTQDEVLRLEKALANRSAEFHELTERIKETEQSARQREMTLNATIKSLEQNIADTFSVNKLTTEQMAEKMGRLDAQRLTLEKELADNSARTTEVDASLHEQLHLVTAERDNALRNTAELQNEIERLHTTIRDQEHSLKLATMRTGKSSDTPSPPPDGAEPFALLAQEQKRVADLIVERDTGVAERSALRAEITRCGNLLADRDVEIIQLREEFEQQADTTRTTLTDARDKLASAVAKAELQDHQIAELITERNVAVLNANTSRDEIDRLRSAIARHADDASHIHAAVETGRAELQSQLERQQNFASRLAAERDALSAELAEMRSSMAVQAEKDKACGENVSLALAEYETQSANLRLAVTDLQQDLARTRQAGIDAEQKHKAAIAALRQQIEDSASTIRERESDIRELDVRVTALQAKANGFQNACASLTTQLSNAQELNRETTRVKATLVQVQTLLNDRDAHIAADTNRILQLEAQLKELARVNLTKDDNRGDDHGAVPAAELPLHDIELLQASLKDRDTELDACRKRIAGFDELTSTLTAERDQIQEKLISERNATASQIELLQTRLAAAQSAGAQQPAHGPKNYETGRDGIHPAVATLLAIILCAVGFYAGTVWRKSMTLLPAPSHGAPDNPPPPIITGEGANAVHSPATDAIIITSDPVASGSLMPSITSPVTMESTSFPAVVTAEPNNKWEWPNIATSSLTFTVTGDAGLIRFGDAIFVVRDQLSESGISTLRKLAGELREHIADYKLVITGHTDDIPVNPRGPFRSNTELGMARSKKVTEFLVIECGLPSDAIKYESAGSKNPPYSNVTLEDRIRNRTVTIKLVSSKTVP